MGILTPGTRHNLNVQKYKRCLEDKDILCSFNLRTRSIGGGKNLTNLIFKGFKLHGY